MYNPALGRFMQTDPAGDTDHLNLYQYALWDPIMNKDPMGREVKKRCVTTSTSVETVEFDEDGVPLPAQESEKQKTCYDEFEIPFMTRGTEFSFGNKYFMGTLPETVYLSSRPCSQAEIAMQNFGEAISAVGADVTMAGAAVTTVGAALAGAGVVTVDPPLAVVGGYLVAQGVPVLAGGGIITSAGVGIQAMGGRPSDAISRGIGKQLGRAIPSVLKPFVNDDLKKQINSSIPSVNICK